MARVQSFVHVATACRSPKLVDGQSQDVYWREAKNWSIDHNHAHQIQSVPVFTCPICGNEIESWGLSAELHHLEQAHGFEYDRVRPYRSWQDQKEVESVKQQGRYPVWSAYLNDQLYIFVCEW